MQKQHREFARHRDHRSLLGRFSTPLRQRKTPAFEVGIGPAGAQHVLSALHKEVAEKLVTGLGDVELGFERPGLALPRTKAEIGAHRPGSGKTAGILDRELITAHQGGDAVIRVLEDLLLSNALDELLKEHRKQNKESGQETL